MFFSNSIANRKGFLPRPALFRAWTGGSNRDAGSWQSDAIREITGHLAGRVNQGVYVVWDVQGAFTTDNIQTAPLSAGSSQGPASLHFAASRVVQTAEENRPVNVAVPVILYLGVPV